MILLIVVIGCAEKDKSKEISNMTAEMDAAKKTHVVFNGPCVYRKTDSSDHPFNAFVISDRVELVSYDTRIDSNNGDLINRWKFNVDNIRQRVTLNRFQRDSLFSLLYNYSPSPAGIDTLQADCYSPRHAIVFYEKEAATAFLELCFECGGRKFSSNADFGQFCPEKMCMLQNFFKANKVDFGIINEMCQ